MKKPIPLNQFLPGLNVSVSKTPPFIHSTSAHLLPDIVQSGKLLAMPCNVFANESLCYCFVGRAAYKVPGDASPAPWQLPIAFVLRFQTPPKIKRIFPFDSGAFRQHRLPTYISTFKLDGYEISGDTNNVGRLITFFFKSAKRYVERRAAGYEELISDHNLEIYHQEILAAARLFLEHSSPQMDDRAAAIEVQIGEDISLAKDNLLGVVMPEEFKRWPGLVPALKSLTANIQTYTHFPLSTQEHYGQIYDSVAKIYKKAGINL